MAITMPQPISAYFAADGRDGDAVAECFTQDAIVRDERKTHVGRDAIRDWKANASRTYTYSVAPFAIGNAEGKVVVTAKVSGNFPGSPLDLRYLFTLDGDKISSLEIKV